MICTYAHFVHISVGHQIQYVLPNVTDDDIFVRDPSNDNEPLDEGDMGPTTSNTIKPSVNDQQNQALKGETTDDEQDSQSDVWDDEDNDISMIDSDDKHCSSEDYGESEDKGPDFKF
jgi:hypothetical protein